jgi:hypothetical protein
LVTNGSMGEFDPLPYQPKECVIEFRNKFNGDFKRVSAWENHEVKW